MAEKRCRDICSLIRLVLTFPFYRDCLSIDSKWSWRIMIGCNRPKWESGQVNFFEGDVLIMCGRQIVYNP